MVLNPNFVLDSKFYMQQQLFTTKDGNFLNVKNRGGIWEDPTRAFETFLVVEKFFRCKILYQKRKT